MARGKKKESLTTEERLQAALVPESEQPYPVPRNWCWTQLGTYIDFATDYVANGSFASLKQNVAYYKEENYAILVKTQDFSNSFTEDLTYTDKRGYDFLKKSVLYGGELILSNIGSIGKVFRVPHLNKPMTLAPNSIMIKCYRETDYDLLYYYFLSPFGTEQLYSITTGTAVKKFNKTDLKTICLPLPPLSEQQRIVDRIESLFAKLDEAKQKAQDALDSFETRKAAILHKAFAGELTAQWRKEHGVGMESWDYPRFEDCILKMQNGLAKRSGSSGTSFVVLRLANLSDNGFVTDDLREILLDEKEQKNYSLKDNDVLMIRVNGSKDNVGKQFLFYGKLKWAFCDHIIRITYKTNLSPEYMVYFSKTNTYRRYIEDNMVSSAGQNTISRKGMASLLTPIPLMDEQNEIIRILDNLLAKEQQAKEAAEGVLEQIDLIKKTILARAFRGELGTNDPSEESAAKLLKVIV